MFRAFLVKQPEASKPSLQKPKAGPQGFINTVAGLPRASSGRQVNFRLW